MRHFLETPRESNDPMSGKQVFNWRESDRSEHLAGFLLSALGMATPVERQEELGADLNGTWLRAVFAELLLEFSC
jgi:hypothetical protein